MRIPEKLFYIGIYILPFALGSVESKIPVLSLGLIFLLIPSLLGAAWLLFGSGMVYKFPFWVFAFLFFSILTVISSVVSPDIGASLYRALINLEISGLIFFVFHLSSIRGGEIVYKKIFKALIISGVILSLEYICHFVYKGLTIGFGAVFVDRVVGGEAALNWGASNHIAGCLLITSLLTLIAIVRDRLPEIKKKWLYLIFSIQVFTVGITSSRTVLVILIFFSLFLVFKEKGLKKTICFSFFFTVLSFVAFQIFAHYSMSAEWTELLSNRVDVKTVSDMSGRTEIWSMYLQKVWEGYGMPTGYYSAYKINDVSAHNNYLTLFYELGWIGGGYFTLLIIFTIFTSLKYPKNILGIVFLAAAINMMAEDLIYLQVYSVYFWFVATLIYLKRKSIINTTAQKIATYA